MASPLQFDPTSLSKYGHLTLVARTARRRLPHRRSQKSYKGYSASSSRSTANITPATRFATSTGACFGKTDRYYIKEYEEETNLKAHLLVDASGSMGTRAAKAEQVPVRPVCRRLAGLLDAASARRRRPGDARHAASAKSPAARQFQASAPCIQRWNRPSRAARRRWRRLWHNGRAGPAAGAWSSSCRTVSTSRTAA